MARRSSNSRRKFLGTVAGGAALVGGSGISRIVRAQQPPGVIASDRPNMPLGIQIGDVVADQAVIWSRADRASRMMVEWSTSSRFGDAVRVRGPYGLEPTDYTARVDLQGLPEDREIHVRVFFQDLEKGRTASQPVLGKFRTAPRRRRDIRLLWSGDTAGQGWGSNPDIGGMRIYKTMREAEPDFFIHSGDTIYADGPMQDLVTLPDGGIWKNQYLDLEPGKRKVAETLDEFRGCYRYNMRDPQVQAFAAAVPQIWQWDDHEVINNWSEAKDNSADPRYVEKRIPTLIARGTRAFLDYAPMRPHTADESERVYRHLPWGRELDVFVVDMRSYRGPNTFNRQESPSDETAFFGRTQLEWLKRSLASSRATWKIIAADMPIGLLIPDGLDGTGRPRWEAIANGNGPALGRELEVAELLRFIKRHAIQNIVWLTADVHYTAAHYYDPRKAVFQDFLPFWEFVSGPLNAGSFGPNGLDDTFGPQAVYQKAPPAGQVNLPPSAGLQFFGQVDIDARSKDMVVALRDIDGNTLFSQRLAATGRAWHD